MKLFLAVFVFLLLFSFTHANGAPTVTGVTLGTNPVQFGDSFTVDATFNLDYDVGTTGTCSVVIGNLPGPIGAINTDFVANSCSVPPGAACSNPGPEYVNQGAGAFICGCPVTDTAANQNLAGSVKVGTGVRYPYWPIEWQCTNSASPPLTTTGTVNLTMLQPNISFTAIPSISLVNVPKGTTFNVSVNVTNSGQGAFPSTVDCSFIVPNGINIPASELPATCSQTGVTLKCISTTSLAAGASAAFMIPINYTTTSLVNISISCGDTDAFFNPVTYEFSITAPPTPSPISATPGLTPTASPIPSSRNPNTSPTPSPATTTSTSTTGTPASSNANMLSSWLKAF